MKWMIYGANGYTGELIARQAVKEGLTPVLAGRRPEEIERLGQELGCETRIFSLSVDKTTETLKDIDLVLHCAGPFTDTSQPMVEACLASHTHYLDITGEIEVFEYIHSKKRAKLAQEAGVLLCSGVGFDVIPTDCVARKLKELMPPRSRVEQCRAERWRIDAIPAWGETASHRLRTREKDGHRHTVGRRLDSFLHDRHPEHHDVGAGSACLCLWRAAFGVVRPDSRQRRGTRETAPLRR